MMNIQENRLAMLSMIVTGKRVENAKKLNALNGMSEWTFYYRLSHCKQNYWVCGSFATIDKAPIKRNIEIIYPNSVRVNVENDHDLISQLIRLY
jgi:hypothetical protein